MMEQVHWETFWWQTQHWLHWTFHSESVKGKNCTIYNFKHQHQCILFYTQVHYQVSWTLYNQISFIPSLKCWFLLANQLAVFVVISSRVVVYRRKSCYLWLSSAGSQGAERHRWALQPGPRRQVRPCRKHRTVCPRRCNAAHRAPWLFCGDILQPHFLQDLQALLAVLRHTLACDQLLILEIHRVHAVSLERLWNAWQPSLCSSPRPIQSSP